MAERRYRQPTCPLRRVSWSTRSRLENILLGQDSKGFALPLISQAERIYKFANQPISMFNQSEKLIAPREQPFDPIGGVLDEAFDVA